MPRLLVLLTLALPILITLSPEALAQPAPITYQGRLTNGSAPVNGTVDATFTLYRTASGGSPVGGPVTVSELNVASGLFTTTLDFGRPAFSDGAPRWVEVAVRSPAGSGPFTTLLPRQAVTAAPLAVALQGVPLNVRSGLDTAQNDGMSVTALQSTANYQSFTPTRSGKLTAYRLVAFPSASVFSWRLHSGLGTGGPVLASGFVPLPSPSDPYRTIDLSASNVYVTAGERYTFAMLSGGITVGWVVNPAPGASGQFVSSSGTVSPFNYWFETYIDTNEFPSTSVPYAQTAGTLAPAAAAAFPTLVGPNTFSAANTFGGATTFNGQTSFAGGLFLNSDSTVAGFGGQVGAGKLLAFGGIGDTLGGAESTDLMAFQRYNVSTAGTNTTQLRLILGDDALNANFDYFSIGSIPSGSWTEAFRFGSNGVALKTNGTSWTALSDARLKHNIQPLEGALEKLTALRGVTFEYNDPAALGAGPGRFTGFLAQEAEAVFPDWVTTDEKGYRLLTIKGFEALAVEAFKAQQETIKSQQAEINDLKARLERLERALNAK